MEIPEGDYEMLSKWVRDGDNKALLEYTEIDMEKFSIGIYGLEKK